MLVAPYAHGIWLSGSHFEAEKLKNEANTALKRTTAAITTLESLVEAKSDDDEPDPYVDIPGTEAGSSSNRESSLLLLSSLASSDLEIRTVRFRLGVSPSGADPSSEAPLVWLPRDKRSPRYI